MPKDKPHRALLYASTEHATTRSFDGSNWTVNVGNTIYAEKVDAISPLKVTLANLFPNVTQYNNTFNVSNTDAVVVVVVPVGQYTAAEFAAEVTTQIAATNVTLTISTAGVLANHFEFTSTSGTHGTTTISSTLNGWWNLIGYAAILQGIGFVSFAQSTSILPPNLPNLSGEKIVHIACDKIAHGNLVHAQDGKIHDVIMSVPLTDTAYGFNTTFLPQEDDTYMIDYRYTCSLSSTLDFQLLDSKMRSLPYPPNQHIQMMFKLYHNENRGV